MFPQEDLQKELEAVRYQVEHHPQLAKYALEVKQLKSNISKLREDPGIVEGVHKDGERVQALQDMYKRIMSEQQGIGEGVYFLLLLKCWQTFATSVYACQCVSQ